MDKGLTNEQQLRLVISKTLKEMLDKAIDMLYMDYGNLAKVYTEEILREIKMIFK